MFRYIIKRLLIFVPTIFVISLLTFIISINTPGDPVDSIISRENPGQSGSMGSASSTTLHKEIRKELGLDLPVFYFSISNATYCDTLYRVPLHSHRATLERLSFEYGDWESVSKYYSSLKSLSKELEKTPTTSKNALSLKAAKKACYQLLEIHREDEISATLSGLQTRVQSEFFSQQTRKLTRESATAFDWLSKNKTTYKRYLPQLNFYGLKNQYHVWMFGDVPWFSQPDPQQNYRSSGFLRGDFGRSYYSNRPVSSVIWEALTLTFSLSIIAIIMTYIIAIPIGVRTAIKKGTLKERITSTGLFMLYSMPNFWVGTLLIIFLCDPDYLNLFPSAYSLMTVSEDAPFYVRWGEMAHYLVLPLICWTYPSLAYLSRQMRGGMLDVLKHDYIQTARAKGLSERKVVWKHAFKNALIPVITLFASVFPLAISGSIVIELIFSIPGMGKISLDALLQRDYPIVFTVMMFTAILTLIGTLIADILYAVVDPRIQFNRKQS